MLPLTEIENPRTVNIDQVSTLEALQLINAEDAQVAAAVSTELPKIAEVIERVVARLKAGGRLFYVGTGTSGRLGVLDASEIPPTYGVSYELVQGVIAGGYEALYMATEVSEDQREAGGMDLKARGVRAGDVVIGIAASGRTPYTRGAVEFARDLGCFTACIVCAKDSALAKAAEIAIEPFVGPEAITGSTRMKAGTAQKMVLNMISTVAMIRLGYVSGNRMTNVKPSNEKLKDRSLRILIAEAGLTDDEGHRLLKEAGDDLRVALFMARTGSDADEARSVLEQHNFVIDRAVEALEVSRKPTR